MPDYHTFTSARLTEPDRASLLAQARAIDPTSGVRHIIGSNTYVVKKATVWTAPQITAAQNVIDTAPAASAQLSAQSEVDTMSIFEKAIILTILDQFNLVRSKLSPPLAAITVQQMIQAVRDKAGTL